MIEGIPTGTRYTVEEINASGYTTEYEGATSTVSAEETSEATVTNTAISVEEEEDESTSSSSSSSSMSSSSSSSSRSSSTSVANTTKKSITSSSTKTAVATSRTGDSFAEALPILIGMGVLVAAVAFAAHWMRRRER